MADASAAVAAAESRLAKWRDDADLQAALPKDQFRAGLLARLRVFEDAERELARARERARSIGSASRIVTDEFYLLGSSAQRDLLREALECVFVRRGAGRVEDRTLIFWRGDARAPRRPSGRGVREANTAPVTWPDEAALASIPLWAWRTNHPLIPESWQVVMSDFDAARGTSLFSDEQNTTGLEGLSRQLGRAVSDARDQMASEERWADGRGAHEAAAHRAKKP